MTFIPSAIDDRHRAVQQLLPWHITGHLADVDRLLVDEHLRECAACRADLATEIDVSSAVATMPLTVDLGWDRLQQQLAPEARRTRARAGADRWRHRLRRMPRAATAVITFQAAAIAGLVFLQPALHAPAPYRVLGSPPLSGGGNIIVMFEPGAQSSAIATALQAGGARIVDGPTEAGAFVLAVPGPAREGALAALRRRPEVTMAEPIEH